MRASRVGSVKERFLQRVSVDKETDCWNWTGPLNPKGYGRIAGELDGKRYAPKGQAILAHRASWIIHFGEIPESDSAHGTVVMHKCDNPACVNPLHLVLGTQAENVADMIQKGRKVAGAWQTARGISHFRAAIKDPAAIEEIRSTKRQTKALSEKYGVHVSTIHRIRNGKTYAP